MSLAAVTGAITSCLLAIGFVYFTQHNYPLITGGMPLFSFWATGVVFYEMTMFGAIVTTFFWFLRKADFCAGVAGPPFRHAGRAQSVFGFDAASIRRTLPASRCRSAGANNIRRLGDAAMNRKCAASAGPCCQPFGRRHKSSAVGETGLGCRARSFPRELRRLP